MKDNVSNVGSITKDLSESASFEEISGQKSGQDQESFSNRD